jgi:hypothetical protein
MGGAVAALTGRRYFNVDKAIPCHYGSFPVLDQTAEKFAEELKGSSTEAVVPKGGETIFVLARFMRHPDIGEWKWAPALHRWRNSLRIWDSVAVRLCIDARFVDWPKRECRGPTPPRRKGKSAHRAGNPSPSVQTHGSLGLLRPRPADHR